MKCIYYQFIITYSSYFRVFSCWECLWHPQKGFRTMSVSCNQAHDALHHEGIKRSIIGASPHNAGGTSVDGLICPSNFSSSATPLGGPMANTMGKHVRWFGVASKPLLRIVSCINLPYFQKMCLWDCTICSMFPYFWL